MGRQKVCTSWLELTDGEIIAIVVLQNGGCSFPGLWTTHLTDTVPVSISTCL